MQAHILATLPLHPYTDTGVHQYANIGLHQTGHGLHLLISVSCFGAEEQIARLFCLHSSFVGVAASARILTQGLHARTCLRGVTWRQHKSGLLPAMSRALPCNRLHHAISAACAPQPKASLLLLAAGDGMAIVSLCVTAPVLLRCSNATAASVLAVLLAADGLSQPLVAGQCRRIRARSA
jgi:hypothetical protein